MRSARVRVPRADRGASSTAQRHVHETCTRYNSKPRHAILPMPSRPPPRDADRAATRRRVDAAASNASDCAACCVLQRVRIDDDALLTALRVRAAATGAVPDDIALLRAGLRALMDAGRLELRRELERLPPPTRGLRRAG
jgi:hypothetical protein